MFRFAALLPLTILLTAQQAADPWSGLRAQNSGGREFSLRLLESHPYRQGELIQVETDLPLGPPAPNSDESWQLAGVLLDPPRDCGTVEKPCMGTMPFGWAHTGQLARRMTLQATPLNHYLPPLAPGTYRAAFLARRLTKVEREGGVVSFQAGDSGQAVISRAVSFEIIAAPAAWVQQTVAASAATLRLTDPATEAEGVARRTAAEQLAAIQEPAAWAAALEVLPVEEAILFAGLRASSSPKKVCDLMRSRVPAPSQVVSTGYFYTISDICATADLPPTPPTTGRIRAVILTRAPVATAVRAKPDPAMEEWWQRRRAYTEKLLDDVAAELAGSVGAKTSAAKQEAYITLFQRVQQLQGEQPPRPEPAWGSLLTRAFIADFPSMDAPRKSYLLQLFSSAMKAPAIAPLLESTLDEWKPGDYYEAPETALRALYRVDPARAQARIRAELGKEKTWLQVGSLELLPARALPEMDEVLLAGLERGQGPNGWNAPLAMAAVAKYASPQALARVRAAFESRPNDCQPELLAYFLRIDPPYASRVLQNHPVNLRAQPPRCTLQYVARTAPLAMGPALEQYITDLLNHSHVFVKSQATQILARYGSPEALPKLWAAFRYFHEYWKGKAAELAANGEGTVLEVQLRNAIARGRGWLATESDLREIESLCTSGQCIQETRYDLEAWKQPLRIEVLPQPGGMAGHVAQYNGLETMEALKAKLDQFPRGTRFTLLIRGAGFSEVREELTQMATAQGWTLETP